VTVSNTAPPPTRLLLGDQAIEPKIDFNNEGLAEAAQAVAASSGTLAKATVYLDATSTATKVLVGIYSDAAGHPGTLLSTGTLAIPLAGAWNDVQLSAASVTAGTTYWIALLAPVGSGTIRFRDRCCGGAGAVETSAQSTLTSLPTTWSRGTSYQDGPFSVYGSGN